MDVGENTRYARLVEQVEKRKRDLGEKAARFPKSKEEYLEMPIDERMEVAMNVLRAYATIGKYSPGPTPAHITPEDRPGIVLTGAVGYRPEETISWSRTIPRRDYESISVSVGAKEQATGLSTSSAERIGLGQIKQGSYIDGLGARQEGWVVLLNDRDENTLPLSSPLGEQLVEFVDVGVSGLIEGKISEHRKFLGERALEGANG